MIPLGCDVDEPPIRYHDIIFKAIHRENGEHH